MPRAQTASFVTEIPLKVTPAQEHALLVRLDCARMLYNDFLGESLNRAGLLQQSKLYQAARAMPRGEPKSEAAKARSEAFKAANLAVGFTEFGLHAYAVNGGHSWLGEHLDSLTVQAIATRAFKATQRFVLGIGRKQQAANGKKGKKQQAARKRKGKSGEQQPTKQKEPKSGRPRFKGQNQMDSVEGKTNTSGIMWKGDRVKWCGLELAGIVDPKDPVMRHGLSARVKYVRLVRRKLNGKSLFYAQLVCEGLPYRKPKHAEKQARQGTVGLDIGPSTVAVVGPEEAQLEQFCAELDDIECQARRLQRGIDRQRRASNPERFNEDGTVKPGPGEWRKSQRQIDNERRLSELYRAQAAYRKTLHGRLVNRILAMGNDFRLEKLSYRALQRRYGRSVGKRAPGMFVALLKRKAASAGFQVSEFPTHTTRLSQTCHKCGTLLRKPLSQRWHACACGVSAQRDLYSAFLARCVEDGHLNATLAETRWPVADLLLGAAFRRIKQPANGRRLPTSFGLRAQPGDRAGRPKAVGSRAENPDGVAARREPGKGTGRNGDRAEGQGELHQEPQRLSALGVNGS